MKPQDPPSSPAMGHTFESVLNEALTNHVDYKKSYLHAFDLGIRAPDLIRYAFNQLDEQTRRDYTHMLARSPWALSRVVALVKARRDSSFPPVLVYDSRNNDELEALRVLDQF